MTCVLHLSPGVPLVGELSAVRVDPSRVEIDVEFGIDTWLVVDGGQLFHLGDESAGGPAPVCLGDTPVRCTLRLGDDVRSTLLKPTPATIGSALSADRDDALHQASSWFLTAFEQDGGANHRTAFADAPRLVGSAPSFEVVAAAPPSALMTSVASMLRSVGLEPIVENAALVRVPVHGDDTDYQLFVHQTDRPTRLVVFATAQQPVPADRRPSVADLIVRINHDLVATWFDLDLDDGTLSARGALPLEGVTLADDTLLENVVSGVMDTFDEFWPAVQAVGFEGFEPSDFPPTTD